MGGGQFEQIGEDLPTTFKLQICAVPHNKLRKHLKEVGTKLNPMLLPIPQLLKKKKKRFLLYSHLEVLVAQKIVICVNIICVGETKIFNVSDTLRPSPQNVA